ncbi:MAG: ATP-binding protein [Actinomycetota bacterium]
MNASPPSLSISAEPASLVRSEMARTGLVPFEPMAQEVPPQWSIPEVWFEPADGRRLSVLVRRLLLGTALLVIAFAVVVVVVMSGRIKAGERFEDRQLVAALAAADPSQRAELAAAAGREAMLVFPMEPSTSATPFELQVIVAREVPDEATLAWLRVVAVRAVSGEREEFTSEGSDGRVWWHATATAADGSTLVVHRPASQAMASAIALRLWMTGLAGVLVMGLVGLWLVLRRRVERSTNTLMEAVDDLRVRGEMRPVLRDRLEELPDRPVELKRLARAVTAIEADIRSSFNEIDALLQAAELLGRSLDPGQVLATALEHVERLLDVDGSSVIQLDHRHRRSSPIAVRGHDAVDGGGLRPQIYDAALPSVRSSESQAPVQVADTESDFVPDEVRSLARRLGYRSMLAVPLPSSLESPMVIMLYKATPHTYSHHEIELSASFASIAGAALRNAELFARTDKSLQEQSSRLSAIVESVDDGLLVEAGDGRLLYANGTMVDLLAAGGEPALDMVDLPSGDDVVRRLVGIAVEPTTAATELERLRSSTAESFCELELRHHDGADRTWRVRRLTVADERNQQIGQGLVWTDVTRDRQLDRMKSGLLATVSHEFRTPLALIKGYASTLLAEDVEWEETDRREFLHLVATEADRLTGLVQRLLDMRRIDAGMLDLRRVPIELDSIIAAAVAGVGAERRRVTVGPVPRREVLVDETRIVTAVRNVVENACTYSPPDKAVEVEVELRPGSGPDLAAGVEEIRISVLDRGPGVPDEAKSSIFEVFVRGNSDLDAPHAGTGLGLAIARGFVVAHGGRIRVEDRAGGGSIFQLAIPTDDPLSAVETPAARAP